MSDILVELKIKDFGNLKIELYPKLAPNTVSNFLSYVEQKFYDGLIFHRIIKGFMIQGGGSTKRSQPIKGEFKQNSFDNPIRHEKGVISMARTSDPNSATSQFFIMHKPSPHLDGGYAAFGKVIEGLDIIDQVAIVPTDHYDKPLTDVTIESLRLLEKNVEVAETVYL